VFFDRSSEGPELNERITVYKHWLVSQEQWDVGRGRGWQTPLLFLKRTVVRTWSASNSTNAASWGEDTLCTYAVVDYLVWELPV